MARGGRSSGLSASVMATAVATVGVAIALAMAAGSAEATVVDTDCHPMDLANNNITDYIRWSSTSNRLYLENGACITMTDIYNSRVDKTGNKGPLYPYDETTKQTTETVTGSWYLTSDIYVTGGSKLLIHGSSKGGDCDHLLLASSPGRGRHPATVLNLRAHGGDIVLYGTHVETWDMAAGDNHRDYRGGRSYISAISEVIGAVPYTCLERPKENMGEARLDIIDSEVNHLGWDDSESYGIAYKVRGFCKDLSNPEIFDEVSVRGDILGSNIHHNYFGHYSYGHQGGNWSNNEVHDNIGYGFDPHDDSDNLIIHDNHVHNNGWHGIIASKRCGNVSIQNNHVHDNGMIDDNGNRIGNGIMLHRSSDDGIVKNNLVHDNFDSGVALYESSNNEITNNKIYGNKNGIRMSLGSSDNLIHDNEILINGPDAKYAIYLYRGNDLPGVAGEGADGRPRRNRIYSNTIISDDEVVKMLNSDETAFEGNVIYGRYSRFEDSYNTMWHGNFLEDDIHEFKLTHGSCFDPAGDVTAPEYYSSSSPSSSSSSNSSSSSSSSSSRGGGRALVSEEEGYSYSYSYSYEYTPSTIDHGGSSGSDVGFFCLH